MDDRAVVERQLGRPPRAFGSVVVRCPFGLPAVTEQEPYDAKGEPFPTTYYVTCPHLISAIARLEAAGGVERWSDVVQADEELRNSLERATSEQRGIRSELAGDTRGSDCGASLDLGIGGSRSPGHLKCLHAHVAYALARPGYELGQRMFDEVVDPWPGERCCTDADCAQDRRSAIAESSVARRSLKASASQPHRCEEIPNAD